MKEFSNGNIKIKELTIGDEELYHFYKRQPEVSLKEKFKPWFESLNQMVVRERGYIFWAISVKSGEVLGMVEIFNVLRRNFQSAFIDFHILEKGKSQGTEIISLLLDCCFEDLKLFKVKAMVVEGESNFISSLHSLGFKKLYTEEAAFFDIVTPSPKSADIYALLSPHLDDIK
jgi:RimJ/RimL family protein N-acetyltransferase